MKKYFKRKKILIVFLLLLLVVLSNCVLLNLNKARTILSLTGVDDYPLYSMKYYGGYHLSYEVAGSSDNGNSADNSVAMNDFNMMCSSFLARNEKGEPIFCRNLDYTLLNHPITVLYTDAPGKNASLTMADLFYLGYNKDNPPGNSIFKDKSLLSAPRVTIDGMNEYGLSIAILSVPYAEPPKNPDNVTTDEVGMNRLILDNAKTIDEAISEFNKYNIKFAEGAAHFMIADADGNSAVIEFLDGKISVVKSEKPWQVCTNFILSRNLYDKVGEDRYDIAERTLGEKNGILTKEEAMNLLSAISQDGTVWSVVYNLKTGEADIVMGREYGQVHTFYLDMKN